MVSPVEILVMAVALVLAARVVLRGAEGRRVPVLLVAIFGGTLVGAVVEHDSLQLREQALQARMAKIPVPRREADGFVGSDTCRSCHPREHATWHDAFHRTMTQVATPEAVVGDFDDVTLESRGYTYRLSREDDVFYVEMVDAEWERARTQQRRDLGPMASRPRRRNRVVMTTGSHWMQTYWYASKDGRELLNVPFVYVMEDQRWIPRDEVFLRPPDARSLQQRWNDNCLNCHTTYGQPRASAKGWSTAVAELGIACEACHGPARDHVERHRSPLARYAAHLGQDGPDPTIVNPARLEPARAGEVCGQCHAKAWINDFRKFNANGLPYRPGDELARSKTMVLPRSNPEHPWLLKTLEMDPTFLERYFWSDGMIRVSGREHNGMVESACYGGGQMSCLSCHALHSETPELHPHPERSGDAGCLHCHQDYAADVPAHTHHAAGSTGSECVNCHMPYTSYGLMRALRSHLVDSPTVTASLETGRPNACNGCHLDRTLGWTAEHLESWWGVSSPELSADDQQVAASVRWLLEGDAGQRALMAWAYGWAPAAATSGTAWMAPLLAVLLEDPYATVRFIAARSLRTLPGFESLEVDTLAPEAERAAAAERVRAQWTAPAANPSVLVGPSGLDVAELTRRLEARNDRPLELEE